MKAKREGDREREGEREGEREREGEAESAFLAFRNRRMDAEDEVGVITACREFLASGNYTNMRLFQLLCSLH